MLQLINIEISTNKTKEGGVGTIGHIIALPYLKDKIDLSMGKPMLNNFFFDKLI